MKSDEKMYRTELAKRLGFYVDVLENYKPYVDGFFPLRVTKLYHDAVTRLTVAVGDMGLYARTFDNVPKDNPTCVVAGKERKGTGERLHKRKHVRTRPLPDAAVDAAEKA